MFTEDEIRKAAYRLWQEEGQPDGRHLEHYFRAAGLLEEQEAKKPLRPIGEPQTLVEASSETPRQLPKSRGKNRTKKDR